MPELDTASLNRLIHIALIAEIAALWAIGLAGVGITGHWAWFEIIRPWLDRRALERERRGVLAHPERTDLSATIIRGQEKWRSGGVVPHAPPTGFKSSKGGTAVRKIGEF